MGLPRASFYFIFFLFFSVIWGRTWTTKTGSKSNGELFEVLGDRIGLLIKGREYHFSLSRFIQSDQEYVRNWKKVTRCPVCSKSLGSRTIDAGGVNAHISFDLPIAAADTAPGAIEDLRDDFERINTIISVLLDEAQEVINESSRGMRRIDRMGGDVDEWLALVSLQKMRARAWSEAQVLAGLSSECRKKAEQTSDRNTANLGRLIARPPRILQSIIDLIRLGEQGKTAAIITGLADIEADISCLEC